MTLHGLRILVPRGGRTGARWAERIAARGGEARIHPLIETAPPLDPAPLAAAAAAWRRGAYDWAVVTSPRGARAFAEAAARGDDAGPGRDDGSVSGRLAAAGRLAAVGPATADELTAHGLAADIVPASDFSAAGIAATLLDAVPRSARVLLPLSEIAGRELEAALREAGHDVARVTAYRTVPAPDDPRAAQELAAGRIDVILASSGSVAREIARRFAPLPARIRIVAIGPPTARALREHGLDPAAVAAEHTLDGLLDAAERLARLPITSSPRDQEASS